MRKGLVLVAAFILIAVACLSACTSTDTQELKKLEERIAKLEDKLKEKDDQIAYLKQENQQFVKDVNEAIYRLTRAELDTRYLRYRLNEAEKEAYDLAGKLLEGKVDRIPLFAVDSDNYEAYIDKYLLIPKQLSLKEKLDILAQKLSLYYYRGLPIEVKEIKLVDGKKIAIVNLREAQDFKESSPEDYIAFTWCMVYFQGSCGGITTSKNLIESFLQRDFKGAWIDGVQFLYEGGRVEFEHVGVLWETQYR